MQDALQQNLTLNTTRATTLSTRTGVQAAQSAFDPQLLLTPSYNRADQALLARQGQTVDGTAPGRILSGSVGGTLPFSTGYSLTFDSTRTSQDNPALLAPGTLSPTVNNTLAFSISQPLLRGFGPTYAKAPVDIAEFSSRSAQARLERQVDLTVADVESAYWSLGLAEAIERLSRDSYDRARELQSRNDRMLELKLISEVDAITSRRGVQERLTSLTDATRRRRDAAERLLFLVYGRSALEKLTDMESLRTEPPTAEVPSPGAVAELETQALAARQDFQAARLDLSGAELARKANKNALLPDIRVSAAYTASTLGTDGVRFSTSRVGDLESRDWKVGVTVSYPLGNRAARAAYARARHDAEAQAETLASFENLVRADVRAAARAIEANRQRLEQAQLSFNYAKEQYAAGQRQLQLGLLDSFRLLQMEEDVSGTELVLEQTRYDLAQAITNYHLAVGAIGQRYRAEGGR